MCFSLAREAVPQGGAACTYRSLPEFKTITLLFDCIQCSNLASHMVLELSVDSLHDPRQEHQNLLCAKQLCILRFLHTVQESSWQKKAA
jgi:hypothetical protein